MTSLPLASVDAATCDHRTSILSTVADASCNVTEHDASPLELTEQSTCGSATFHGFAAYAQDAHAMAIAETRLRADDIRYRPTLSMYVAGMNSARAAVHPDVRLSSARRR